MQDIVDNFEYEKVVHVDINVKVTYAFSAMI